MCDFAEFCIKLHDLCVPVYTFAKCMYVSIYRLFCTLKMSFFSEERAAQSLLTTAQYNRRKGHKTNEPEVSDIVMSKDRKIRVRRCLKFEHFIAKFESIIYKN